MKRALIDIKIWRLIFWIFVCFCFAVFFVHFVLPDLSQPSISPSSDLSAIKEVVYTDVIQYNIAYLTLAITIIFVLGGAFYLLNIKPLEKKLEEQDVEFGSFKIKIGEAISNQEKYFNQKLEKLWEIEKKVSSTETKIKETETRIQVVESRAERIQLDMIWNQHLLWQSSNLHANDILALVFYLELIVEIFNKTEPYRIQIENSLRQMSFFLDMDNASLPTSVYRMAPAGKTPRDMMDQHFSTLMRLFSKINGFDALKTEVREKMIRKWFGGGNLPSSSLPPDVR